MCAIMRRRATINPITRMRSVADGKTKYINTDGAKDEPKADARTYYNDPNQNYKPPVDDGGNPTDRVSSYEGQTKDPDDDEATGSNAKDEEATIIDSTKDPTQHPIEGYGKVVMMRTMSWRTTKKDGRIHPNKLGQTDDH